MIKLEVEPYCQQCLDFTPDVVRPEREIIEDLKGKRTAKYSDTIVHCKYRNRCAGIERFIRNQRKGESNQ